MVGEAVVAIVVQRQLCPWGLAREPLGLLPGDDPVALAGQDEQGRGDALGGAGEGEHRGLLASLAVVRRARAPAEGRARQRREAVVALAEVVRAGEGDGG